MMFWRFSRTSSLCRENAMLPFLMAALIGLAWVMTGPTWADSAKVIPKSSSKGSSKTGPKTGAYTASPSPQDKANPKAESDKSGDKARMSDGQKDFCHLVSACRLTMPKGYCPDTTLWGPRKFSYDSARCLEARQLTGRGVGPDHPRVGYRLYRFLGMEYRVIYQVEDVIPISIARLNYLLQDLPLSAKLIHFYRKEPYSAQYTDEQHRSFTGVKGKHLRGEATLISGDVGEKRLFYFGTGIAEVAWWVLKGPALMDFRYSSKTNDPSAVHYSLKVLVFPGNGFINKIMNMGLFKKIVLGKIKEVLIDITETAKMLAKDGGKSAMKGDVFSDSDKARINEFLKLP
jgi:hypothetical protein